MTVDRNLAFQQPVTTFDIAVFVLCARSNRLSELRGLLPELLAALPSAAPGRVTTIGR